MTTIANYNVNLSMDANSYIDSTQLSRKETASLQRTINSTRSPAEKYERTVNQLDNALMKGAISQRTYNNLLEKQAQKLNKTGNAAKKASGAFSKFAAAVATLGISRLLKDSVKLSMETEQMAVKFKVLTGSAESAASVLDRLRKFAASTPFQFNDLSSAATKLLAFGSSTRNVVSELRMLGDISSGVGMPIGELADLYGKARVQQTLFAEDINQFTGRGVNVISEFAKQLGVAESEVKKLGSEGKITFENLQVALQSLTSDGGVFQGMTAELAETAGGKASTAMDKLKEAMIDMGEAFTPVVLALTDGFEDGQSAIQGAIFLVEKFADTLAMVIALAKDLSRIVGYNQQGFKAMGKEFDRIGKRDSARAAKERLKGFGVDPAIAKEQEKQKQREKQQAKIAAERKAIFDELNKAQEQQDAEEQYQASNRLNDAWTSITDQAKELVKAQEESARLSERALVNAKRHFELERQRAIKRRQDIVSQMSGAGAEIGSGADVAFLAQQQNARLASESVTVPEKPTEENILDETRKQYELLKQEAAESRKQTAKLTELIKAVEENKIKPIR